MILMSSFAHKMDFAHNFSVDFFSKAYIKYESRLQEFGSVIFF